MISSNSLEALEQTKFFIFDKFEGKARGELTDNQFLQWNVSRRGDKFYISQTKRV